METAPPAPAPCLFTWFAGGSIGYLTEFENPSLSDQGISGTLDLDDDFLFELGGRFNL